MVGLAWCEKRSRKKKKKKNDANGKMMGDVSMIERCLRKRRRGRPERSKELHEREREP